MPPLQSYGLLLLIAGGLVVDTSHAQSYPTKFIHVLAAGLGGSADRVARTLAQELTAALGQQVVVENRPSNVAIAAAAAKAPPDGYMLMVNTSPLWVAPLFGDVPYDPIRDLAPIAALSRSPSLLVVHPSLPVRSVAELVKLAKARPGELNNSTGGIGGSAFVAGELFKSLANVNIVRIGYKSQSTEDLDLLSGQVQMTISASVVPHVQSGKLRALATGGSKRSILFPDLPTVAETVPGFQAEQLVGLWAPAKTPDAIVRRLNQETVRALEKPEVRNSFLKTGMEPAGGTPEQLTDYMKLEMARVSKMIKDRGIKREGT